jgi:hypothetical protein
MRMNPPRRRRRKARRVRRRSSRRRARRAHRRYGRRYRKNPGGMLLDLAKQAAPVLVGLYGARLLVSKIGPMLPGVSALGSFQGPALSIGAVVLVNFATKRVAALAKYRNPLLLGTALAALDTLITAFAPASVKAMIGVGDVYDQAMLGEYVQMGEYMSVDGTPIDDDIAMSDYIAVGADGLEEELGMGAFEELGAMEELGNDLLGGVSSSSMMRQIPTKQFLSPIPARSFTRQIPPAGEGYDSPGKLYQGVFRGGF